METIDCEKCNERANVQAFVLLSPVHEVHFHAIQPDDRLQSVIMKTFRCSCGNQGIRIYMQSANDLVMGSFNQLDSVPAVGKFKCEEKYEHIPPSISQSEFEHKPKRKSNALHRKNITAQT